MTSRVGARLRNRLWRAVWALAGGLRVSGAAPTGPAVVVANHSSHADTAALLAALPPSGAPVFAAAAEYWFDVPARRALVTSVAAALPVRRGTEGGYAALRAAAEPVLAGGGVVVVYPEGTRSMNEELGEFRSGALRLARETDVALVPAALLGTADVLPKNGRFRPRPAEVRFGAPLSGRQLDALDAAGMRRVVQALLDRGPVEALTSRVWRALAARVALRPFLAVAFGWGIAEALSWPVIAEMCLVLLAVSVPRRVLPAAAAVAAGSVVGAVLHAWLASRGVGLPLPLTTPAMHERAAQDLAGGPWGVWAQAFNGVPIKVYAVEAGRSGLDLGAFAVSVAAERSARILGVGVVLAVAARLLHPWLKRLYGTYLIVVGLAFSVLLTLTVSSWS